ncbi:MAG: InlB B-repeat-containing protein, partial [Clostridiales bacterium]|nr:InlB B-repeat-containing protein [Clostridiales bacterium]
DGNTEGVEITKDEDGKYIIVIDDAVFTGSTITLKAKWIKNNYGISFIDWDGSVIVENAQVPYGSVPTCETPARGDTTEHSYTFAGWKNTASGEVFKDGLPVATGSVTYQATYTESKRLYSVDASVSPSGAGTVTVSGSKRYSETAALTVEPAVGYHVVGWTNNSTDTGVAGTAYNFTVSGDHTVVVNLEKNHYAVNVTSSGGGEVVYNGPENPEYGELVKVVATPYEGYHFVNWVDQGDNEVSKDAAYEFEVEDNYSYKAVFTLNQYAISVNSGDHGSVSGSESGTYNHFDSCEVVATPDKGYHFVGWEENGTIVSENDTFSFSVTGPRNLKAVFEINMYTVTYKNDDGTILQEGEMSWGSTASYQHMANPTKKPTAQFTYTFAGWDNKDTLVTKDITYTATYTYTVNKYKITFANEDGTVLQTGEIEYGKFPVYEKDTPTKAATVQETFTFAGWDKEISKVTGETVYTATYTSKPITKDSINYKYFTVAFVTNGGSEIVSQLVAEGGVAFKPEEPLRERYTFGGWYIDAALTKPFSFATVITSDITLYAKWIKGSPDIEATYAVVGLGSTSFELGSGEDITVAVERSKDNDSIATHFKGVLIDGVEVDYYNYELAEDNNSVIIRADAFEGLEAGNHTITIVYDDGTAEVELVVEDANEPTAAVEKITETEAGDTEPVNFTAEKSSNWGLWIALGIVAVVVIAAIPIFIIKGRSLK